MRYNLNKNEGVTAGTVAVWNIQVGVFEPAMVFSRLIPAEQKYWKLKVVLN